MKKKLRTQLHYGRSPRRTRNQARIREGGREGQEEASRNSTMLHGRLICDFQHATTV